MNNKILHVKKEYGKSYSKGEFSRIHCIKCAIDVYTLGVFRPPQLSEPNDMMPTCK